MATELNDKIQDIMNARNDIKQAVYNKTAISQSDDIRTYANMISNINIANSQQINITENGVYTPNSGYTGFNIINVAVPSLNTSDATASSSDIVQGMTAYVNNTKIYGEVTEIFAGSIFSNPGFFSIMGISTAPDPEHPNNVQILATYNWNNIFLRNGCYQGVYLEYNQLANAIGLTADKIKFGETILGITGTYSG